jgi:hypothetical protein
MSAKKNKRHLIGIIQTASYMLLLDDHAKKDIEYKGMTNQSMSYLKKEVKKLKRL